MKEANLQNSDLLNRLRLEIERAWNASQDEEIVHRLARAHPELSSRLYEFFSDVVAMSLEPDESRPELKKADDRMRAWLETEGYRKIAQSRQEAKQVTTPATTPMSTPQPQNLIALLKGRTGEGVDALAGEMGITSRFLLDLSDHPTAVPERARREVARRVEHNWSVAEDETLLAFQPPTVATQMRRAASRSRPFTSQEVSYDSIVRRSGLEDEQKHLWLSLA